MKRGENPEGIDSTFGIVFVGTGILASSRYTSFNDAFTGSGSCWGWGGGGSFLFVDRVKVDRETTLNPVKHNLHVLNPLAHATPVKLKPVTRNATCLKRR